MRGDIDVGVLCIVGWEEEDESTSGFEHVEGEGDEGFYHGGHFPWTRGGDVVR